MSIGIENTIRRICWQFSVILMQLIILCFRSVFFLNMHRMYYNILYSDLSVILNAEDRRQFNMQKILNSYDDACCERREIFFFPTHGFWYAVDFRLEQLQILNKKVILKSVYQRMARILIFAKEKHYKYKQSLIGQRKFENKHCILAVHPSFYGHQTIKWLRGHK